MTRRLAALQDRREKWRNIEAAVADLKVLHDFLIANQCPEDEWHQALQSAQAMMSEIETIGGLDGNWDHLGCVIQFGRLPEEIAHSSTRSVSKFATENGMTLQSLAYSSDSEAYLIEGEWPFGRMRMALEQRLFCQADLAIATKDEIAKHVNLYPVMEDEWGNEILETDLDWMRRPHHCCFCHGSSTAAGLRHRPTGIVVEVDRYGKYAANRDFALQLLKSQLRFRKQT